MNHKIVIGGLGGSGTRVYAQILKNIDYYLGSELNKELDNLLFTRLFKNASWYQLSDNKDICERLKLFYDIMSGQNTTPEIEINNLIAANLTYPSASYSYHSEKYTIHDSWGWKEPNSHIYIKQIAQTISNLKFILVVRNGLDMAFSSNIQQLNNWGELLFNIAYDKNDEESVARAQLEYWIKANNRAIKAGILYLRDNFLVCNFDKLCSNPTTEIIRILHFLGYKASSDLILQLSSLPKAPSSVDRYRRTKIKFSSETLIKVHKLNVGLPL